MKIDYISLFNNAVLNAMETIVGIQVLREKSIL